VERDICLIATSQRKA